MPETKQNLSENTIIRSSPDASFGDVIYQPRSTFGPRFQPNYQLVVVLQGEATITLDGHAWHLPERHVALLKPCPLEHFAFSRVTRTHHTWCAVATPRVSPDWATKLDATPFCVPLSSRLQTLIDLGLSTVDSSPAATSLISRLADATLQQYVLDSTSENVTGTLLPEAVLRAKAQIETEFASPLTVEQLARTACCSTNHLTRLFTQHLHVTPARYLWQVRVERGVELLRQSGFSVAEIAARTGFQSPFHFSRLVRQEHGLSPRELRAEAWRTRSQV